MGDIVSVNNNMSIKGFIDGLTSGVLTGWIFDSHYPEESQPFSIEVDGHIVTNDKALCYREDLLQEGFGSGKCGFSVNIGLTNNHCSGKLIRLLDKYHNPIQDAEYRVGDIDNKIDFELVNRYTNSFEFLVTCQKRLAPTKLSLLYGEACISLMSLELPEGESSLNVAIPLGILDGFNDVFSICLDGYPAPLWIANKVDSLWSYKDKKNTEPFSLLDDFKSEALDLRVNNTSDDKIANYLSAYRYLSGSENLSKLYYKSEEEVDASIILCVNSNFIEYDLINTIASILLSYNRALFSLIIFSDWENQEKILELMKSHNIDCTIIYFNKGDSYFDVLSLLNSKISSEYTVVINEPINVSSYWLDEIISPFLSENVIANATTAKVISKNGDVLMPTSFVDINGTLWNTEQNVHPSHPSVNFIKKENRTNSTVWCVKTSLLSEGENTRKEQTIFNTLTLTDIAYIRGIGLDIVYSPKSQVIDLIQLDNKPTFQAISKKKKSFTD